MFWVHADSETTFTHDYKLIARKLGVADGLDGEEVLTAVREQIERGRRWVLILDNADDLGLFGVGQTPQRGSQTQVAEEARILYDFIPRGPTGTVLWTSRDERIAGTLCWGPASDQHRSHDDQRGEEAIRDCEERKAR